MVYKALSNHNIFIIKHKGKVLIYAPLQGVLAETSVEEVEMFEKALASGAVPDSLTDLCVGELPKAPATPDELSEITILMNQRCNFSCRYCYSAGGRSSVELPSDLFDVIADWFVTNDRLMKSGDNRLSVTFSGGGDPMLSFDRIKSLILKLRLNADRESVPLHIGLVCNGSLVKDADAKFLSEYIDNIVISFDVIQEIHDAQRSHYSTVAGTIRELGDKGIKFGLRSTITALNVTRMCEMVQTLADEFPACKSIAMEAVLSPDMWESAQQLHQFYNDFVTNYFAARRLGEKLGISVGNTMDLSSEGIKSRACPGKISIAPDGTLTACSRVATSGDRFFEELSFGQVDKRSFRINESRYARLMDVRADNIPGCKHCFARYNCGGACMLARLSYSPSFMQEHCNFTRAMLINSLTYDLD